MPAVYEDNSVSFDLKYSKCYIQRKCKKKIFDYFKKNKDEYILPDL